MQLIGWLDRGAHLAGADAPCLIGDDQTLTYGETQELTHRVAARLDGVRTAAVLATNEVRAFAAALGCVRAGARWVPLNARAHVDELSFILTDSGAQVVVWSSRLATLAGELRERHPSVTWLCLDDLADWAAPAGAHVEVSADPEDVALIGYTGGTTGRAKGVQVSHRSLEAMTVSLLAHLSFRSPPRYLAAAPLTHAAGAVAFPVLALGGSIRVLPSADAGRILTTIAEERITFCFLPPTVIYLLLAHPAVREVDLTSMECLLYGAAPMAAERVREAMDVFGPVLAQVYGQAEAPLVCAVMNQADHVAGLQDGGARLSSAGRPGLLAELAIVDEDGNRLGPRATGEVQVRGSLLMTGYLGQEPASGWHRTGDVGYFDEEGWLFLVDRKKDMIITGGFNVYSSEVEAAVLAHPAVQQVAVVGIPDERWGEAVHAVVEVKPGCSLVADELIAHCKQRLGSVKSPKSVELVGALPRSSAGKVLKREVRDRYWVSHDRPI